MLSKQSTVSIKTTRLARPRFPHELYQPTDKKSLNDLNEISNMLDFLKTEPQKLSPLLRSLARQRKLNADKLGSPLHFNLVSSEAQSAYEAFVQKHNAFILATAQLQRAIKQEAEEEKTKYMMAKLKETGGCEAIEMDANGKVLGRWTSAGKANQ